MKIRYLGVLLFPILLLIVVGCNYKDTPLTKATAEWKKGKIPELNSEEWYKANWSEDICITLENDTIVLNKNGFRKYSNEMEVENGTFIGVNNGEWGGSIKFNSDSGLEYEILNENFCGFYSIGERKFVLTGLFHQGADYGYIYELVFTKNKWNAEKILDIESCPEIFLLVNEDVYIATNKSLIMVKDYKVITTLMENVFWKSLYPNSLIYIDNSILIGMRGGVLVYDSDKKKETWYDFSNEQYNTNEET